MYSILTDLENCSRSVAAHAHMSRPAKSVAQAAVANYSSVGLVQAS